MLSTAPHRRRSPERSAFETVKSSVPEPSMRRVTDWPNMLFTEVVAPESEPMPTLTLTSPSPVIVASPATISRAKPV